ncbi:hypothetical protein P3T18_005080 [Paraburkholderia sp. GAS199]
MRASAAAVDAEDAEYGFDALWPAAWFKDAILSVPDLTMSPRSNGGSVWSHMNCVILTTRDDSGVESKRFRMS